MEQRSIDATNKDRGGRPSLIYNMNDIGHLEVQHDKENKTVKVTGEKEKVENSFDTRYIEIIFAESPCALDMFVKELIDARNAIWGNPQDD